VTETIFGFIFVNTFLLCVTTQLRTAVVVGLAWDFHATFARTRVTPVIILAWHGLFFTDVVILILEVEEIV
jgi:hypothetical protein